MDVSHQFWAGVVFAAVCLLFLIVAFLKQGPLLPLHYQIVHFVCALCAGAAGGFFTGVAAISAETALPGGKLAFQGAAGAALFALVFFVFSKVMPKPPPDRGGPTGTTIAPGNTTTFHQVAETLVEQAGGTIDLSQLTKDERSVVPRSVNLECGTLAEAKASLVKLATLVPVGTIRPYIVELNGKHFTLRV